MSGRYQVRSDRDFPLEFSHVVDTFAVLDGDAVVVHGSTRRAANETHELACQMNEEWAQALPADQGRAR